MRAAAALSGRVPDGDMARALEWVQECAVEDKNASRYLPAIEEAIAAYDPKAGGRTALSGREAVAWTKVRPTVAGVYRVRGWHIGHPDDAAVVEIVDTDRGLMCNMHCYNTERDIAGQWGHLSSCSSRFEWSRIDATTPQPGDGVVVPEPKVVPYGSASGEKDYAYGYEKGHADGWNACRAAMIAAAPSAKGVA